MFVCARIWQKKGLLVSRLDPESSEDERKDSTPAVESFWNENPDIPYLFLPGLLLRKDSMYGGLNDGSEFDIIEIKMPSPVYYRVSLPKTKKKKRCPQQQQHHHRPRQTLQKPSRTATTHERCSKKFGMPRGLRLYFVRVALGIRSIKNRS
jgi:hypothetical protein